MTMTMTTTMTMTMTTTTTTTTTMARPWRRCNSRGATSYNMQRWTAAYRLGR